MGLTTKEYAQICKNLGIDVFKAVGHLEGATSPAPSKYRNKKKEIDGITFDSSGEAKRYLHLKMLERCGDISDLKLQPVFVLQEKFRDTSGRAHRKIEYRADFEYIRCGLVRVVEDFKGFQTPTFRLKEKLFRQKYPNVKLEIVK